MMRGFRVQGSVVRIGRVATQRSARPFHSPQSKFRFGLTLVELLVTIAILAILASVFLGVTNAAMDSARSARTKTTIGKIHSLLMERWNSYSTRRVDLAPNLEDSLLILDSKVRGYVAADARLFATRELMKLEMPDRWSDITEVTPSSGVGDTDYDGYPGPELLARTPAVTRLYRRQYEKAKNKGGLESLLKNQGAECLFMIIMHHTGDGEARTHFTQQEIGDTDGDGAEEFLDGWGRPINFIRWPAGFFQVSSLMHYNPADGAKADHDPFDPFRRDQFVANQQPVPDLGVYSRQFNYKPLYIHVSRMRSRYSVPPLKGASAYRLVPLVYSAGSDGEAGLETAAADYVSGLDPYEIVNNSTDGRLATPLNENSVDNVHNHLLDGS